MIRMTQQQVIAAWTFVRAAAAQGMDLFAARDHASRISRDNADERLLDAVDNGSPADLEAELKQLALSTGNYEDGRVIEDILKVVNRAYARNTLDGGILELARLAIMIPGERAKLAAALDKIEGHCVACGHEFVTGEVAVFNTQTAAAGRERYVHNLWFCTRCGPAEYQACQVAGCDDHVMVTQKVQQVLSNRNLKCKKHLEELRGKDPKQADAGPVNTAVSLNEWFSADPASRPQAMPAPRRRGITAATQPLRGLTEVLGVVNQANTPAAPFYDDQDDE